MQAAGETPLRKSLLDTATSNPEQAAEARRLSLKFGAPPELIERNLDEYRRRERVDVAPALQRQSPALSSWLQEHPSNAAIAKDDMEQLGFLEWVASAPAKAFAQTMNQQAYARLRYQSMFRPLTQQEHDELETYRYQSERDGALGVGNSWFRKVVTGTGSFLANQVPVLAEGAAGAAVGAAAGSIVPGFGTAAGAIAGGRAGVLVGVLKNTYQQETANAYDEYQTFRDEAGRPLDPDVIKVAAMATGMINAPIEAGAQEFLLRSIPGLRGLSAGAVRQTVKQALLQPTVRAALLDAVKSYGTTITAETAQEVAQRGFTILFGELAKTRPGAAAGELAAQGLRATGVLELPHTDAVPGLVTPGNIDNYQQPTVENADGSVSTVDSLSVNLDGREVLLPTVTPDGRHFAGSDEERTHQAVDEYRRTGRHLGMFDTPEHATAFAEQLHNDYAAGTFDHAGKFKSAAEWLSDLVNEGAGALQSFALGVAAGPFVEAIHNTQRVRQARAGVAFFNALGDGVTNSKTVQRLPGAAQAFLEQATKDGPVSHVYAPVEAWTSYWQSKGVDPGEVAAKLTGDPKAYERAVRTGEDLAIPTATYAVNLAATDHHQFFAQELRLAPDRMNGREADALEKQLQAQVQQSTADGAAAPAAAGPVREKMLGILEGAGVERSVAESYATLYEHAFGALGERAGMDPADLFDRYGLQVTREGLDENGPARELTTETAERREIPASTASANETSAQYAARVAGHTAALTSAIVRDAQRVDPHVDVAQVTRELEWRLAAWEEGQRAASESDTEPGNLLRAIAKHGGLWYDKSGEDRGEISQLLEGRDIRAVKAGTGRVVHNRGAATWKGIAGVVTKGGKTLDGMLEALQQDGEFQHLETPNDLLSAVEHAIHANTQLADFRMLPGTAELRELGVRLGARWWEGRSRVDATTSRADTADGASSSGAAGDELADSVDTGDGDTSFEFSQGMPLAEYYDELHRRLLDQMIERERVHQGTAADVPDNPAARSLEVARRLASITDRLQRRAAGVTELAQPVAPVVMLAGDELGAGGDASPEQLRDAAWEYYKNNLQPRELTNTPIGSVAFSRRGLKEFTSFGADPAKLRLLPAVPAIIERGTYLGFEKARKPAPGLVGYHRFTGSVVVADRTFNPTVFVREDEVGNKFYDVLLPKADKTKDPGTPEDKIPAPGSSEDGGTTLAQSIGGNADRVNIALSQENDEQRRGVIRFGQDRQFNIELLRHADLSTFLHESGHFYLEVVGDLAQQLAGAEASTLTPAQTQLVSDYQAILGFLGVASRDHIGRDQHEQFARAFESYLMEGHAPSVELRGVFARFRAWLVGIYRSLRNLNVELSDQVRGAFDRMLATDQAIDAAEQEGQIAPLFLDAQSAGMTELEFGAYLDTVRDASQRAREELQARLLGELKREEYAWWTQERDAIRTQVASEMNDQPVYRALSLMRTGKLPDGSLLHEGQEPLPMKLSRESLVAQFGRDILKQLPRPYVYSADSGISVDAAAELFGFSSADEFVKALVDAKPMRQVVDEEVDARMYLKHGDVMRDGRLEELARAAVEGEHRQTVVQAELRALTRGMVQSTIPPASVINDAARTRIAATQIRNVRPGVFLMASRRASRQAFELLAAGTDRAGAVRAKLQELVNLALYREARDAKERVESMRSTLQALGSTSARQRIGKAGADYLEQIDAFLERYELARVPQKEVRARESLRAWAEAREAEGLPVEIPPALLDDARRVNYQDISVEEFTGVYDAVEQIAHLARLKNELLKSAKKRSFEELRDTVVSSIRLHNQAVKRPLEFRPADEKYRTVADWFASHRKIAMLARALDGHEDGGEFWEAIIRPINAAADEEQARFEQAGATIVELLETAYPKGELGTLDRQLFIPAIGNSLSKEARLMVALNWGNEGNRARLLADPTRSWNEAQIAAILDTLDERDWRFVQGVWDYIDSFWPEIEAKQKRVTGIAPEKVPPAAVDTKFGTFRGGYFPIVYDGRLVARAGVLQKTGEANLATQAAYVKATTRRGHTQQRLENVKLSVRLELGVIAQHVQNVIHDLTHHEMLIDANRLIGDAHIQQAILETKGDQVYAQFTNAVRDIALGNNASAGMPTVIDKAAAWMRTRTQIAMMAWNVWTALQQPFGMFNGMSRVGPMWVARGMRRWLRDAVSMENTAKWIYSVSPMMKSRGDTATQDLHDVRQALAAPGGWFDNLVRGVTNDAITKQDILDTYLWHIGKAQQMADIPTWLGAYEKAAADSANYLADGTLDDKRVVALADQAVLDSQGGGQIKDLAQVQRGSAVAKLLLTFYSYGNTVLNATADAYESTNFRRPTSIGRFIGHLGLLYAMPALGTVALSRALGRSGGGGDDRGWLQELAREMLSSAMNTMVLVREFSGLISNGVRGWEGPAGMRSIQAVYDFGAQARQGKVDEAFIRTANTVSGILFGYPAAQVQKTIDGWTALREGRTRNPFALVAGAPKKKAS